MGLSLTVAGEFSQALELTAAVELSLAVELTAAGPSGLDEKSAESLSAWGGVSLPLPLPLSLSWLNET